MLRAVAVVVLSGCLSGHAVAATFDADISGEWQFNGDGSHCEMRRSLGMYGEVRFSGEPGRGLVMEIRPNRDYFGRGAVQAVSAAPQWHQDHPSSRERGELRHVNGGVLSASDPLATSLMMDLYAGFTLALEQSSWYAQEPVSLKISPVRFRASYDQFARCYQWLMPANFEEVERSRVLFGPNKAELAQRQKDDLSLVAEYVLADREIDRVYIDGHTDATGRERDNMRLSEQRARAVAQWLVDCGVPKDKIVVRYHAARYPVAKATDPASKQRNRRATVRLERLGGEVPGVEFANTEH